MSGSSYVYRKARTNKEQKAGTVVALIDAINQVNYGTWFIFLGIKGALRSTFFAFEKYFFLGSFILNAVGALFYLYSYINAANRNLFKLSNIAIRVFSLSLVLLMTFGAALLGPTVMMAARVISLLVNPILFLTRFVYFTYKYFTETRPSFKAFFLSKVLENGFGLLISSFIITGIVLLYTAGSFLLTPIMLALSILGPVVVLGVQAFKLFSFLHSDTEKMVADGNKAKQDPAENLPTLGNTTARLSAEMQDGIRQGESRFNLSMLRRGIHAQLQPQKGISNKLDLHRHSLPKAVDISELRMEVTLLKKRIQRQMQKTAPDAMPLIAFFKARIKEHEIPKRNDKIAALEFLEVIMQNFEHIQRSAIHKPIRINETFFTYSSVDDLFNQIQQHVLNKWPDAFQSWLANISHTEACFQTLCMLLNEKFLPTPKSEATPGLQRRS